MSTQTVPTTAATAAGTNDWSWDPTRLLDPGWLHWAATVPLLAAHVAGVGGAIGAAVALCAIVAVGFYARLRSTPAMAVQVRLGYLALLGVGLLPHMWWMHWSQLLGTSAMVLVGYCPLVRMLTLLPWNRREPLTRSLAHRVFTAAPTGGLLVPPSRALRSTDAEPPVLQGCC
jgi:hypothetical protein